MTQSLLGFIDLPIGAMMQVPFGDRGQQLYGRAVDPNAIIGANTLLAETKIVAKNGNDATGDGSIAKPFLTIQAAITSITDATSAKPYTVLVFPGVYNDTFTIAPWVYVRGVDQLSVYIGQTNANWITAGFAAGTQDGGISCVTLTTNITVNFATIASLGIASFKAADLILGTGVALSFTGNQGGNTVDLDGLLSIGPASSALTLASINSNIGSAELRNGVVTITGTDAFASFHRIQSLSSGGAINVTWTGAVSANALSVTFYNSVGIPFNPGQLTISGAGAQVFTRGEIQINGPNADTTFSFGKVPNGGTVILPQGADVTIVCAGLSANRTYTFEGSGTSGGTRVRVVNQSTSFLVDFAFAGGASLQSGSPSYVQAAQTAQLIGTSNLIWSVVPMTQYFQVQLTNGVSANVAADIDANSCITATLRTFNTATGFISAKGADRVNGTHAGGGTFKLTSESAAGATTGTDQSTYDVHIVGLGAPT